MTTVTAAERILMGLGISDPKEIDLEVIAVGRPSNTARSTAARRRSWGRHGRP
jgi:hypothetical protein